MEISGMRGDWRLVASWATGAESAFRSVESDHLCFLHNGMNYSVRIAVGSAEASGRSGYAVTPSADGVIRLAFEKREQS